MASCGPDVGILQEIFVNVSGQGLVMAQGGHATNGKTSDSAHKIGIRAHNLFARQLGQSFFVDPVATAGND